MATNFEKLYDVIIVGGGPAGLSASIYSARAKYKTLVIEKERFGGQIVITDEIVNYPAVYKTSGEKLTEDMKKQAESFGAQFKLAEVLDIDLSDDIKTVVTSAGEYQALSIILAPGAHPRQVGFSGEKEYRGRGVAYCATCDGEFFQNMPIYVIGGGFAAVEESMFLTKYASKIKMIVRGSEFTCAKTITDKLYKDPKISVSFDTEVVSVSGGDTLNKIKFKNNRTNEEWEESPENGFGVFVFAGYKPNTAWLKDNIQTKDGYIVTDANQKTNVDGVYAAGDVCIKNLRQVVTAVSDGAIAATSAEKYVEQMHSKLNLPEFEIKSSSKAPEPSPLENNEAENPSDFLSAEIKTQLAGVFAKFESKVIIKAVLNDTPLAAEMKGFASEFGGLTEKVVCEITQANADDPLAPYMELFFQDGKSSGIRFSTMPGGHEFNSFIIALYNVAGPGKEVSEHDRGRIEQLDQNIDMKILISLSCTMCPEVVMASQRIASLNPNTKATAIDVAHFPNLKEKYKVMSVPCLIINEEHVHFGKKNLTQVLDILEEVKQ